MRAGELMATAFDNFIDQVPKDIMTKTEKYVAPNLIVFRPSSYIIGVETYMQDYHICLPTSMPPPIRVENRAYQYKNGRIIFFPPETKVVCTDNAPTGKYIAMCIKKDFLENIAKEAFSKKNLSFPSNNNPYSAKLVNFIWSLEEEISCNKGGSALMIDSISTQIVIQLLREIGFNNDEEESEIAVHNNYVNIAVEYMRAFYNANIKIEDICKQIYLSPYYFIRMFKKQMGISPHEFLLSIRVNKAEEILKKMDCSIEEVARLCGFANAAHFSAYFKKIKGISPSEYKKIYMLR